MALEPDAARAIAEELQEFRASQMWRALQSFAAARMEGRTQSLLGNPLESQGDITRAARDQEAALIITEMFGLDGQGSIIEVAVRALLEEAKEEGAKE